MKTFYKDVHWKSFGYPGGERQSRLTEFGINSLNSIKMGDVVRINTRIKSSDDLMDILLLANAIQSERPYTNLLLSVPYLPYGRADRRFTAGDCLGLQMFYDLICEAGYTGVTTLDAHNSNATPNSGLVLVNTDPTEYILTAINAFAKQCNMHKVIVLYPDAGAAARYILPAQTGCNTFGIEVKTLNCTKKRDPATGAFLGFEVPDLSEFDASPVLIVDDICDGGGTFLGIAKELDNYPINNLGLYVTHGIFSKGLKELHAHFSKIYTTDSFTNLETFHDRYCSLTVFKTNL